MNLRLLRAATVLALAPAAFAQVHLDWATLYDGEHGLNDNIQSFARGPQGRLYAAGPSWDAPFPFAVKRGLVAGISASGVVEWKFLVDFLPGGEHDVPAMAAPTTGGVVVGGRAQDALGKLRYVLRIDEQGHEVWRHVRNGDHRTWAVCADAAGNVYAGGSDRPSPTVGADFHVARYDATGAVVWERSLIGSTSAALVEEVLDLEVGPAGSVIAAGQMLNDFAVARFADDGTLLWSRTITATGGQSASRVVVDAAGRVFAFGDFGTNMGLAVYDAGGTQLWTRTFSGPQGEFTRDIDVALDPFGGVVVLGDYNDSGGTGALLVVRLDAAGSERWRRTWSAPSGFDATARALAITPAGEAIAAAFAKSGPLSSAPNDLWLAAWDATGLARWQTGWFGHGTPQSGEVPTVVLAPDARTILVGGYTSPGSVDFNDFAILAWTRTAIPVCAGAPGAPCPCGNESAPELGAGCAHSSGGSGRLVDAGDSSLASDSLVLRASGLPDSTALFVQGTTVVGGGQGAAFGDGLRCAGGTLVRLGTTTIVGGACEYPGAGDPRVSVRGAVSAPGTRTYQAWYRNAAPFCTNDTFNLTNGLSVLWTD